MKSHPHLPDAQQFLQRLADKFNADEALWQKIEQQRLLRRKTLRRLTKKQRGALDLLEFTLSRPPDDCIGFEVENSTKVQLPSFSR